MYYIDAKASSGSYPIYIKNGLLEEIGSQIKSIYDGKKLVIITDTNVYELYGKMVLSSLNAEGFEVFKIVVKAGEESKSFETLLEVYDRLLDFKTDRGDMIIALGGGVIGDMAGFAASTFLRGVPFIQIPTSLLAQVDSSIGGKVAVNLPRGKNLVGSFYQPKGVFIDPLVLRTLKDRVFNDGLGEVIKYGVIEDEELFYSLMDYENKEALLKGLDEIIYRCCNIKVKIVEADEMDMGDRMLLNFGHTIGHAIEKYFKFKKFSHGEAVAMGMYAITRLGEEMSNTKAGTSEAIKNILIKYDLPWQLPEMNSEELLKTIQYDKKNISGAMNIVLIEAIGKGFIMKFEQEKLKDYFKKCLKLKI